MRRKVSQVGPSTLMVSLPSKWVKAHHIRKGDELTIVEKGKTLEVTITTGKNGLLGEAQASHPELVKRYLNSFYRLGYDEIKIRCAEIHSLDFTHELSELLGFEVVEQGKDYVVVRMLSETLDQEFETIFNRLCLVTVSLGRDSLAAFQRGDFSHLEQIALMEKTNNKLANLCQRILNKHGYPQPQKTAAVYSLVSSVERIADFYRDICLFFVRQKGVRKISPDVLQMFQSTNELFDLLYHHRQTFTEILYVLKTKRASLTTTYLSLLVKKPAEEQVMLHLLAGIVKEMAEIEFMFLDLTL